MSIFQRLFNKTLEPTEREAFEAANLSLTSNADMWRENWLEARADLKRSEAENRRLEAHIDHNRALFAEIHAQGKDSASGTARSIAAKAAGGMAK